jgi:hypothetical protein
MSVPPSVAESLSESQVAAPRRTQIWAQSPVGNEEAKCTNCGLGSYRATALQIRQEVFIAPTAFHVVAVEAACLRGAQAIPRHVVLVQDTLRDGDIEHTAEAAVNAF